MTEHAPDRVWSGIDISKTIAGALAAVCAAVIGSFLGVAGTLIGAAVASVIGSVGTEIYARSINKGTEKLQTITPSFVKAPAAVGTPEVAAATEEESPSHTVPPAKGGIRWGRVAMLAGALFVLAMGALTVTELVTGRPVASLVGNTSGTGTTVGVVLNNDTGPTPTPAPSESPSESPSEESTPSEETTEPNPTPETTEPTAPATEPTGGAPTTDAPQETPAPQNEQQDGGPDSGGAGPGADTGTD